eukprot:11893184-Ditylum_brightwellii.AAC.1
MDCKDAINGHCSGKDYVDTIAVEKLYHTTKKRLIEEDPFVRSNEQLKVGDIQDFAFSADDKGMFYLSEEECLQ